MVKRVLMIAFHYPPLQGGSGIHRTQAFVNYLPACGWTPLVLTVRPFAHASVDANPHPQLQPAGAIVKRTLALDTARHLALRGRYPGWLAQPDRWVSWCLSAVPAGLRLIHQYRPELIWSTYPIASAHLIALALHRLTAVPWIADQRDPMIDRDYPADPLRHRLHARIEQQAMRRSAAVVCTTPGALRTLKERHPGTAAHRLHLIENGYDEAAFGSPRPHDPYDPKHPLFLLHSGLIYPSERDPRQLFVALARLQHDGMIDRQRLRLVLRAGGHDDYLRALLAEYPGLDGMVVLAPPLPYGEALAEMQDADGLLLLQAASCNSQIPAKLYEYLRARRPVLALTDPAGDSAATLRAAGVGTIARLDRADDIARVVLHFIDLCRAGTAAVASAEVLTRHARSARTRELATLFDHIRDQSRLP